MCASSELLQEAEGLRVKSLRRFLSVSLNICGRSSLAEGSETLGTDAGRSQEPGAEVEELRGWLRRRRCFSPPGCDLNPQVNSSLDMEEGQWRPSGDIPEGPLSASELASMCLYGYKKNNNPPAADSAPVPPPAFGLTLVQPITDRQEQEASLQPLPHPVKQQSTWRNSCYIAPVAPPTQRKQTAEAGGEAGGGGAVRPEFR